MSDAYIKVAQDWDNFPAFDIRAHYSPEHNDRSWYQFLLPNDPRPHGFILSWVARTLCWTPDFIVTHDIPRTVQLLDRSDGASTAQVCNAALQEVVAKAEEQHLFKGFARVLSEQFRILGSPEPVHISRTAAAIFGIAVRGVHMVVFTHTAGRMKIWVPRRASTSFSFPDLLDSAVGGGIRADESPLQALTHEADEEASIDCDYLKNHVRACGALTYISTTDSRTGYEDGLMIPEVAYLYELEVPPEMELRPNDHEVGKYHLMDVEDVALSVKNRQFKPSSAAVMVDFLIRHGVITDENEPDYLRLLDHLHRPLPVPVSPRNP
ncbi:hypothetical protein K491DRAFT_682438 [Lophiostoma macrostomum CBS 122681]|uniref:Nudix hydrolase domain-containing protein n=1 Tax=Lophiostoma macrostomum CBS 122681 TaxID=1314788 RepID=A0A6A6STW9_9PLEO|nr:hypothetical protein K491DRAFT_682438 [Lophiostoma macrostomum CBS 122681]